MQMRALKKFRYGNKDRLIGEEFEAHARFVRALEGAKLAVPVGEPVPPPVQTRQVKAEVEVEEPSLPFPKTEPSRKYKRRDMRASED